jgi:hypothetical protein
MPSANRLFYDIVTGNNSQERTAGTNGCYSDGGMVGILSTSTATAQPTYAAGQGYNIATGIGSANINNLLSLFCATYGGYVEGATAFWHNEEKIVISDPQ